MSKTSTILALVLGGPVLMLAACSSDSNSGGTGGTTGKAGAGGAAGATGGTGGKGGASGGSGGAAGGAGGKAGASGGTGGASGGAAGGKAGAGGGLGGSTGGGGTGGAGTVPSLGAQIDRIGRPAINTAITDPFDANATTHGMKQDTFNAATPSTAQSFEPAFEATLAILDGLDMNCGNQFAADKTKTDATRYKPLADVLLDDQLYIDTSSATCAVYLGVEANATGIIPNTDCGGRTITEDVVDESYSVLATGMTSGVTDGVDSDDKVAQETPSAFPFLAPPN